MNILHMISGGDVGGAKTHVLSLTKGLSETENVTLVCFTEGEFTEDAKKLGISLEIYKDKNPFDARKKVLKLIKEKNIEIIHCHGAKANMMGMLVKNKAGIPILTTVHSDYKLDYMGRPSANMTFGNINRIALRKMDAWIGVSDAMKKTLTDRKFPGDKVFVLYNGVDFSPKKDVMPRESYFESVGITVSEKDTVFGIAARISPVKDMKTLVTAFSEAQKRNENIKLIIAGDGEQREEIEVLAKRICREGTYCFAGWISNISDFFNAIDVNLLTSVSEGFCYALVEGAASKCATAATNVGGNPYIVKDKETGFLFEPGDVTALSDIMVRLAENKQEREEYAEKLYKYAKENFSIEKMISVQKKIYAKVLDK